VEAFASELSVDRPLAELALDNPDAPALAVHAAALLAVLASAGSDDPVGLPRTSSQALAGLLRHEARYWQQSQAARGLNMDPVVIRRVVRISRERMRQADPARAN
jgi:hypothetical protein